MGKEIKDLILRTKTVPLVEQSLVEMPLNQQMRIKSCRAKPAVVRATITKLREKGYEFNATEAGLVDSIYVTRIK